MTYSFACVQKSTLPKRIPEFQDYVVLGEEGSGMARHFNAVVYKRVVLSFLQTTW